MSERKGWIIGEREHRDLDLGKKHDFLEINLYSCGAYLACRWIEAIESLSKQKISVHSWKDTPGRDFLGSDGNIEKIKQAMEIIPCPGDIVNWIK